MSDVEKDSESMPDSTPQLNEDEVRSLLRQAMKVEGATPPKSVLPGVQKRIRQRSGGKFFADGWSTGNSPRSTYFVTSLVMLLILVSVYFALTPGGWSTP